MDQRAMNKRHSPPSLKENTDGCPALGRLVEALKASDGFIRSIPDIDALLDAFRESSELSRLLAREVEDIARGVPGERPPFLDKFTIYQDERYAITTEWVGPTKAGNVLTSAYSGAVVRMLRSDGDAYLTLYRLPCGLDFSTLDVTVRPQGPEMVCLTAVGDGARFNAGDVVSLSCAGRSIMMTLSERTATPFSWGFDRATLTPLFVSSTSQSITRVKTLIDVISSFHGTVHQAADPTPFLLQVGDHPLHFLRWGACQVLAKTDLASAVPLIRRLSEDPHPNVRRAAGAALARVEGHAATVGV